jgi:shikimate dehydrogenase
VNINAGTRLFALLGDPVAHSFSPLLHNAAFRAAHLNAVYVALRCNREDITGLMRALARAGGGGNITVPHKQTAATALERPAPTVQATGACNVFWLEHERVHGDNTDVAGFLAAAERLTGSLRDVRALVLGAGGGARAAVYALLERGAAHIDVWSRTPASARALVQRLDPEQRTTHTVAALARLEARSVDLVVNATPLGLALDDPLPFDLSILRDVDAVLDMVYRPGGTAFTQHAAALGIRAADGGEMLLAQGAAAFECWFRQSAPRDAMRAAFESAAAVARSTG